jgi:hypothetical protein
LPLRLFSFCIENEISVEFDAGLDDDPSSWRLALLAAPPHHMIILLFVYHRCRCSPLHPKGHAPRAALGIAIGKDNDVRWAAAALAPVFVALSGSRVGRKDTGLEVLSDEASQ